LLATLLLAPEPPPAAAPLARFEDGIALSSARLDRTAVRPGQRVELALEWRATGRPSRDYSVFVHLRDSADRTRFQRDRMPGDGRAPASHCHLDAGADASSPLDPPAALPAGEYRLVVGLYELASGRRLVAERAAPPGNEVEVGRLRIGG